MTKEAKAKRIRPEGWGEQTKRIIRLMTEQSKLPCDKVVEMLEKPFGESKGKLTGAGVPTGKGRTLLPPSRGRGTRPWLLGSEA